MWPLKGIAITSPRTLASGAPEQGRAAMSEHEQETKKELAQAKEELLEAKAKLKELSAKLTELSDVMGKIEVAQGRLEKIENKLVKEFTKESSFYRRDTDQD
jgi:hypothetical protein